MFNFKCWYFVLFKVLIVSMWCRSQKTVLLLWTVIKARLNILQSLSCSELNLLLIFMMQFHIYGRSLHSISELFGGQSYAVESAVLQKDGIFNNSLNTSRMKSNLFVDVWTVSTKLQFYGLLQPIKQSKRLKLL